MDKTQQQLIAVKEAARKTGALGADISAKILNDIADAIVASSSRIIEANKKDLSRMDESNPMYDRLSISEDRILGMAADTRNVATLPVPYGETIESRTMPNGLQLNKVRVPLGVVGVIYEARPNVTVDVATLCLRSGNAVVLKGGSDAKESNEVLVDIIHEVLRSNSVDPEIIQLLPSGREAATQLMNAVGYIDILIPRGSKGLIDAVRNNAKVPVIETGAGVVHTYFDIEGDVDKGAAIIFNAKTRRPSVCNSLDCLIIHSSRLNDLPTLCKPLADKNVEILADNRAYDALDGKYNANLVHAQESDFGYEFKALRMAIKTVDSFDEALAHIYIYSSKHSEAIVTENTATASAFLDAVDAACCYHNASTAFTDGAQFGLGAEIGISTQKLHARGPMGLKELTTYKWKILGNGQTRN